MKAFRGTGLAASYDGALRFFRGHKNQKWAERMMEIGQRVLLLEQGLYDYRGSEAHVQAAIRGLVRDEVLAVRHVAVSKGEQLFQFSPYLLLIYKLGLYLVGYSDYHKAVRTVGLDGVGEIVAMEERFSMPKDFDVEETLAKPFGLISGKKTDVVIWIHERKARYVRRRRWHPTQEFRDVTDGVEMTLSVEGTAELVSWVLSFGRWARVLEPRSLVDEIVGEYREAIASYAH